MAKQRGRPPNKPAAPPMTQETALVRAIVRTTWKVFRFALVGSVRLVKLAIGVAVLVGLASAALPLACVALAGIVMYAMLQVAE